MSRGWGDGGGRADDGVRYPADALLDAADAVQRYEQVAARTVAAAEEERDYGIGGPETAAKHLEPAAEGAYGAVRRMLQEQNKVRNARVHGHDIDGLPDDEEVLDGVEASMGAVCDWYRRVRCIHDAADTASSAGTASALALPDDTPTRERSRLTKMDLYHELPDPQQGWEQDARVRDVVAAAVQYKLATDGPAVLGKAVKTVGAVAVGGYLLHRWRRDD